MRSGGTEMTGEWMSMAVSLGTTLHPAFGAAGDASRTALSGQAMVFRCRRAPRPITGPARAAGRASGARRRHASGPLRRSCQVESAVHTKAGRARIDSFGAGAYAVVTPPPRIPVNAH